VLQKLVEFTHRMYHTPTARWGLYTSPNQFTHSLESAWFHQPSSLYILKTRFQIFAFPNPTCTATPGVFASCAEMRPAYQLLASLVCSCDLTSTKHFFARYGAARVAELQQQPYNMLLVADLAEDHLNGEQHPTPAMLAPSPVALEGAFSVGLYKLNSVVS
jgi:hypothetical protein